jgi:hypothetical protein
VQDLEETAMNKWKLTTIGLAAGLVATIGIRAASSAESHERGSLRAAGPCDNQRNMQAALRSLNAASDSLNAAVPDKGGHRANALNLVQSAISEVQAGCIAGGG